MSNRVPGLSNLDALLRVSVRLELAKQNKDLKSTMTSPTHDPRGGQNLCRQDLSFWTRAI